MFHDFVVHVRKYYFSLFQTLWPGCGLCCFSESLNNHCGWEVLALWYWIFDTLMCTDFDTVLHCGIKSTVMCTYLWCVLILTLYCNVVLNPLWCVLTFDTVIWELVLDCSLGIGVGILDLGGTSIVHVLDLGGTTSVVLLGQLCEWIWLILEKMSN